MALQGEKRGLETALSFACARVSEVNRELSCVREEDGRKESHARSHHDKRVREYEEDLRGWEAAQIEPEPPQRRHPRFGTKKPQGPGEFHWHHDPRIHRLQHDLSAAQSVENTAAQAVEKLQGMLDDTIRQRVELERLVAADTSMLLLLASHPVPQDHSQLTFGLPMRNAVAQRVVHSASRWPRLIPRRGITAAERKASTGAVVVAAPAPPPAPAYPESFSAAAAPDVDEGAPSADPAVSEKEGDGSPSPQSRKDIVSGMLAAGGAPGAVTVGGEEPQSSTV